MIQVSHMYSARRNSNEFPERGRFYTNSSGGGTVAPGSILQEAAFERQNQGRCLKFCICIVKCVC